MALHILEFTECSTFEGISKMMLTYPPAIKLAQLPTPIEKLSQLTARLEGPEIYIKRDDYTGIAETGNKVRKLEFILAEAQRLKSSHLITCGGYQSNHARTTAVLAARLGLGCHLVLRNGMSSAMEGNLFLSRLVGAEIQQVTPEEYMHVNDIMQGVALDIKSKGGKAYIIPEGGSNEFGVLGYVRAMEEMDKQLKERSISIQHMVVPVGSGGTYAGLLLGKYLFDLPVAVHGINVCDNEAYFTNKISKLIDKVCKRFSLDLKSAKKEISIIDGYVGKGYGLSSQNEIELIKQVAQKDGIILDPVYTGKAMHGLIDQIRQGRFKPGEKVLFLHTGGIFGLFPKKSLFF